VVRNPADPSDVYRPAGSRCILRQVGKIATRRTNINLDTQLVDAAAAVLGTARTTDTVHAALRSVVDRASREALVQREFADLSPAVLEHLRRPR
jgi:Arc/MetJ family transcription regulator